MLFHPMAAWQPAQSVATSYARWNSNGWPARVFGKPSQSSWHDMQSAYDTGAAFTAASRAGLSWQVAQLCMLPGKPFEKLNRFPFVQVNVYWPSGMCAE